MELHFNNDNDRMKCYHLWNNSKSFDDLFDFEICTRYVLGDNSEYINKKARIIRKGTWGWARDGWLTKTLFSSKDFIFHGWKKSKLGGEWVWPFRSTIFNISQCSTSLMPFSDFIPEHGFLIEDSKIKSMLNEIKNKGISNYFKVLKRLGLLQT